MNKTIKRNVLLTAALTIMLCVSLIAGATFALFTSESKVNIAVTSGKVDVVATASEPSIEWDSRLSGEGDTQMQTSATVDDNTVSISKMLPGATVKFNINIKNNSDVTVQYRTVVKVVEDGGLWAALNVTIGTKTFTATEKIYKTEWTTVVPNTPIDSVSVKVELPYEAGSVYQGKTCKFAYTVEALQGNAIPADEWDGTSDSEGLDNNTNNDEKTVVINNAAQLKAFADKVASNNTYFGYTVKLAADIDLADQVWPGIGANNYSNFPSYFFNGTFDGQGYTIKNMTVENLNGNLSVAGFFNGIGNNAIIKNLNFENANVKSHHEAGVVVGYCATAAGNGVAQEPNALIENCHVNNSVVTSEAHNQTSSGSYDDGDKAGGIVGYMKFPIKNCTVKNTTIIGVRDLGGIVGISYNSVENCSIENVTIARDKTKIDNNSNIDSIVGRKESGNTITNCNGEATISVYIADGVVLHNGVYEISNANGLKYCATTFTRSDTTINKVFKLTADIDMTGIAWTPWCNENQYFRGLFDGQGYTISNLTITDDHTAYDGHAVGFIGRLGENANGEKIIKNVIFDNANVSGHHYVGVAVGYNEFGEVDNVQVTNSKVTATHVEGADSCGDKAGAIIGMCASNPSYISVTNCSATNCEVKAARDAAQLIGYGYANTTYSNLSATNVTVTAEAGSCTHERKGIVSANALVGNGTTDGLTIG